MSPLFFTTERITLERDPSSGLCTPHHLFSLIWDLPAGLSCSVSPKECRQSRKGEFQKHGGHGKTFSVGERVRMAEFRKQSETNKWTHMWQGENKTTWALSTETQI